MSRYLSGHQAPCTTSQKRSFNLPEICHIVESVLHCTVVRMPVVSWKPAHIRSSGLGTAINGVYNAAAACRTSSLQHVQAS